LVADAVPNTAGGRAEGAVVMTLSIPAEAGRPALWSARRTAVAIVAAVGIGSLTAVAVSYADTGSDGTGRVGTGPFRNGQFQGPAGGQFNGSPFGRAGFGNGQLGAGRPGRAPPPAQFGPAASGLPGSP
jgi:hypothetical protein